MKKILPALLIIALLFSGCTAKNLSDSGSASVVASQSLSDNSENGSDSSIEGNSENTSENSETPGTTASSEKSGGSKSDKSGSSSKSTSAAGGITKEPGSTANPATTHGNGKTTAKSGATTNKAHLTTKATTKKPTTTKKSTITCYVSVDWTKAMPDQSSSSYLMNSRKVTLNANSTAYDALKSACSAQGVSLNSRNTMYGVYVAGIGGLNEKEHGQYSGWKYMINGSTPGKSCGKYILNNGDRVTFFYDTSL